MNHTTIRLAIIVVAATLMITGTIFYPMARKQQLAMEHAAKNTEKTTNYILFLKMLVIVNIGQVTYFD